VTARRRFVKTCSCGRAYFLEEWEALPLVGHGLGLEFRNCPCKSTICIRRAAPKVYAALSVGGVGIGFGMTLLAAKVDAVLQAIGRAGATTTRGAISC
jgi:hypothetical protein